MGSPQLSLNLFSRLKAALKPPPPPAAPESAVLVAGDFQVALSRKPVRTLRLSVAPDGSLRATAPRRMPEAEIRRFILSKDAWIRRQRERLAALRLRDAREAAEREVLSPAEQRALLRRQRKQLLADAQALLPKWEPILGVKVDSIGVRAMRSRWGSCNIRLRKISLALALAGRRPELLEYILVHEMTHLLVRKHNARFKAILTRHLPGWRTLNRELNHPPD
jgi:predicted metal-dependent hydrolase